VADRVARRHAVLLAKGATVAITTASAATAREINTTIQTRLGTWRSGPGVWLQDGTQVYAGDRIATRRNRRSLVEGGGTSVRNRQTWTVTAVAADGGLCVADPERGEVTLPADYVARHVELGWAVTGYGNQGITADHGICVVEASTTRAGLYVGMTRGRQRNVALVVDPTGAAEPAEVLASIIQRPIGGETAHAVRDRLHGRHVPDPSPEVQRSRELLEQLQSRAVRGGISRPSDAWTR
jgi:hypothetical protein